MFAAIVRQPLRSGIAPLLALLVLVGFALLGFGLAPSIAAETADEPPRPEEAARIAELIGQLGADDFARRKQAEAELMRLGLRAFDALYDAQGNADIEIALRARYLVRSMAVRWSTDDDPPDVKRILRGYDEQTETERRSRMERLSALEEHRGTVPLCRLIRFESSSELSKQAALLLMQQPAADDPGERAQLAERIRQAIASSQRPAAAWARTFADTLVSPDDTLATWDDLIQAEHETLAQFPERTSRQIVRDLLRWQAELLLRLERREAALAAMARGVDLLEPNRADLLEAVDWMLKHEAYEVVELVGRKYSEVVSSDAFLLYRLAEAQSRTGQHEAAQQNADKALALDPDSLQEHVVVAYALQERGQFAWAEREYRYVLSQAAAGSLHDQRTRFLLSEMLHDQLDELAAAEVLKGLVDAIEADPNARALLDRQLGRDLGSVKSRMHYFFARHHGEQGRHDEARAELEQGIAADETDADVLIAMHRLPGADDDWRAKTAAAIQSAAAHFRNEITKFEAQVQAARSEAERAYLNSRVATMCNQYAWLVSNTVGDYDDALRQSHRSLELRPDTAGYLDTLGRCYYAKGDYDNAIRHQQRAVELEPHTGQLVRQLAFFRAEQARAAEQR